MKVFRDLEITIHDSQIDKFISHLESKLTIGWKRDKDMEARGIKFGDERYFYFVCDKAEGKEAALVALLQRDANTLYVVNIVPRKVGELTFDQYNAVLMEFYEKFVIPLTTELDIDVSLTKDQQSIEDWISSESATKLKRFSVLANKSTGSSHPLDQERWFDFIISVVRNDEDLYPDRLKRWLIEEEGWHEDMVVELAIEYEQNIALLKYYRSH